MKEDFPRPDATILNFNIDPKTMTGPMSIVYALDDLHTGQTTRLNK